MRLNIISTSLVLAMSAIVLPANAATSNCSTMFIKAEKMVAEKGSADVSKKVKGYQMAIDGYQTCSKALAMAGGAERDTMMQKAEREFEAAYDYIQSVE